MSDTIYTSDVIQYVDNVMEVLEHGLHPETKLNFFESEFTTADRGRRLFRKLVSDTATNNFLEHEDGVIKLTMEQMADIMKETVVRASLEELRETGLIDWIENEHGQEIVFLTEKGKDRGKSLFGFDTDDDVDVNLDPEALKRLYEKK
jgi:hypothetical protein